MLLDNGSFIEARDISGRTPLYEAAINGQTEVIDVLATRGADVDAIDYDRVSPLEAAIRAGHHNAVEKLRQHNADVTYATTGLGYSLLTNMTNILQAHEENPLPFLCCSQNADLDVHAIMRKTLALFPDAISFIKEMSRTGDNEDTYFENRKLLFDLITQTFQVVNQFGLGQMLLTSLSSVLHGDYNILNRLVELHNVLQSRNRDNMSQIDALSYTVGPLADLLKFLPLVSNFYKTLSFDYLSLSSNDDSLFTDVPFKFRCNTITNFAINLEKNEVVT